MAVPWAEDHVLGNFQWAPVWNTYRVKQLEQVKIQEMGKRGGTGVVYKFLRKLRQRHGTTPLKLCERVLLSHFTDEKTSSERESKCTWANQGRSVFEPTILLTPQLLRKD